MDALIDYLRKSGLPAWSVAILILLYVLADKLKLVHRPARKSDREMLSADEATFRKALMEEVGRLRGEVRQLHNDLTDCHDNHAALAERLEEMIETAKEAGLDWMIKLTKPAPYGGGKGRADKP